MIQGDPTVSALVLHLVRRTIALICTALAAALIGGGDNPDPALDALEADPLPVEKGARRNQPSFQPVLLCYQLVRIP
ncbi:MAG: hypothetical protein EDR02_18200 [Actinobacteria bacterium]|nr:MAG: hypothetical protein EDR02_18200 [Actinomycetota bacterium]RIK02700.1 MAG: hypothetical protein DCC48_17725 [Acidobacteriota bacterium]